MRSTSQSFGLLRRALRWPLLVLGLPFGQAAGEVADPADAELTAALAELDSVLAELDEVLATIDATGAIGAIPPLDPIDPRWQWQGQFELALGGESNVLLDADNPVASAFVRPALDLTVLTPVTRWGNGHALVFYEGRVFAGDGLPEETLALLDAGWEQGWGSWQAGASFAFTYAEYIFDSGDLDLEARPVAGLVVERSPEWGLELKRWVGNGGSLALEGSMGRSRFGVSSDDYDWWRLRFGADWTPSAGLTLRSWFSAERRDYSVRMARAADFLNPILGVLDERLATTVWQAGVWISWKWGREWELSLPVYVDQVRADAGDYYDRARLYAKLRLSWKPGRWEIAVEGSGLAVDYDARKVNPYFIDSEIQWQRKWSGMLELRRSFGDRWEVFALIRRAELDANAASLVYRTWGGELGGSYRF
jgi:hypothetical protein